MIESIQISSAGHASKPTYGNFLERYGQTLACAPMGGRQTNAEAVQSIIEYFLPNSTRVRYGLTRVFLEDFDVRGMSRKA